MSRKHNKTGRSRRSGPFVMLEHFLLNSPAFQDLSCVERSALIEVMKIYSPGRNGYLAMSARSLAGRLNVSRQTAARALRSLEEHGFIDEMKRGGFNVKSGEARATEWRLALHKCDVTGETASKKFMRWRHPEVQTAASTEINHGLAKRHKGAKNEIQKAPTDFSRVRKS